MSKAFSLFELLITMAIIGILAAISFPLYTRHIMRVQCSQAKMALLEMANHLEQEHSILGRYTDTDINALLPHYAKALPYQFYFSVATKTHFVLNATLTRNDTITPSCRLLSVTSVSIPSGRF